MERVRRLQNLMEHYGKLWNSMEGSGTFQNAVIIIIVNRFNNCQEPVFMAILNFYFQTQSPTFLTFKSHFSRSLIIETQDNSSFKTNIGATGSICSMWQLHLLLVLPEVLQIPPHIWFILAEEVFINRQLGNHWVHSWLFRVKKE